MQDQSTLRHLDLSGALVLANAAALQATITDALDQSAVVRLDISAATEIDVSILQILVAANKTALQDNKVLTIASPGSALLAQQMERCGLPGSALPALHDISTRPITG